MKQVNFFPRVYGRLLLALFTLTFVVATHAQDDPVVILLGDEVETLSDFDSRFEITIRSLLANQGVPLTAEIRTRLEAFKPQFLDQRVTEIVLLNEAKKRGIVVPDEVVEARLQRVRSSVQPGQSYEVLLQSAGFRDEAQLSQLIRESELVQRAVTSLQDDIEVTEDQVTIAYQINRDQYTTPEEVCARHILLGTEEEAGKVLDDLLGGADFEELARERSTGPSAPNGGDLGCFARGRMVPPFEEAAFSAEVGAPIGPVQSQFGFHVILVYERHEPAVQPLEQVHAQIEDQVRQDQLTGVIDALKNTSGVQIFADLVTAAPPQPEEGSGDGAAGGDAGGSTGPADSSGNE